MPMEVHFAPVDEWRLLPNLWSTMDFIPRSINFYLMSGFTPSTAQFIHNNIISKEVGRVFVLRCQSTSHLTCLISSHQVHLSHPFHTIIQVTFIHSYNHHSYINTFTYSYTHTLNTFTYSYFHSYASYPPHNSYMVAFITNQICFKWQVPPNTHLYQCLSKFPQCLFKILSLVIHSDRHIFTTSKVIDDFIS
jgi:hypothetical protein